MMAKRGILLMNIGTPDEPTVRSVRNYLREFLLDPEVISIPALFRHMLVRGIILRTRPKKIAPLYKKIWMEGGSPLRVYTNRISEALEENLEGIKCEVGMRYGNPSIREGLEKLRAAGVDEILLAPLFPHSAQATTGSALGQAHKQIKKMGWGPIISELDSFPADPAYIEPLANSIKPHLGDGKHLLFSYHGLPVSHLKKSDTSKKHCQKISNCCSIDSEGNKNCYARHCMITTLSVVGALAIKENEYSVSYQSRLGPTKWIEPSTTQMVENLAKEGHKKIVIVSPAFLADGLETLEELDIQIREHFYQHGGEELTVVKCLNDDQKWIEGLSQMVNGSFKVSTPSN